MIPGQIVEYNLRIKELQEGQDPREAINSNPDWFDYTTYPSSATYNRSYKIVDPQYQLRKMGDYVWQVKAYSGEQEVGDSDVKIFHGPPLINHFFAGNHIVRVLSTTTDDLNSLTGTGEVRLVDEDIWTEISFEDISITPSVSGLNILTGGDIIHSLDDPQHVELVSVDTNSPNGTAVYEFSFFRLNFDGLYIFGEATWNFPLATTGSMPGVVRTKPQWQNYNDFTIKGAMNVAEGSNYELLDPYQFQLQLDTTSVIYVNANRFWFDWNGFVEFSSIVPAVDDGVVSVPFFGATDIFYITENDVDNADKIALVTNGQIDLQPVNYVIDFSEGESPSLKSNDPFWKGVFIEDFDLYYHSAIDEQGQLFLTAPLDRRHSSFVKDPGVAWVASSGLDVDLDDSLADGTSVTFNSFPSTIHNFRLKRINGQLQDGEINGKFFLPIISDTDPFSYSIPITDFGFTPAIVKDLVGTTTHF